MRNGGDSLHLMNMDANEMDTIAIAIARYALECSFIGGTEVDPLVRLVRGSRPDSVDRHALDALRLAYDRDEFRRHLALRHDEQLRLLGGHRVVDYRLPDAYRRLCEDVGHGRDYPGLVRVRRDDLYRVPAHRRGRVLEVVGREQLREELEQRRVALDGVDGRFHDPPVHARGPRERRVRNLHVAAVHMLLLDPEPVLQKVPSHLRLRRILLEVVRNLV